MDKTLTRAVWKIREQDSNKNGIEVNVALIPTGGTSYQLYFPSKGCRYACTMCNYGFNHPIREAEILKDLEEICEHLPEGIETMILESSGSFLDDRELPEDLQEKIMRRIAQTSIQQIQIETHYKTITAEKLRKIRRIFDGKEIGFEFGLESTTPEVYRIYNKSMDLEKFLQCIWMCERSGIYSSLNLLVGAPLLTINERIEDAINSINWILEKCPSSTSIVIFPLNIKDYTLVKHMYQQGRYRLIYDWEFIEVLRNIPKKELGRVYISWWGNRCNEFHGEEAIIKPFHCGECHERLKKFYKSFVESKSSGQKAELIEAISLYECNCKEAFQTMKKMEEEPTLSYEERLEREKKKLRKELNVE